MGKTLRQLLLARFVLVGGGLALASILMFFLTPHPAREFAELCLLRDSARAALGQPVTQSPVQLYRVEHNLVRGAQPRFLQQALDAPENRVIELQFRPAWLGLRTPIDDHTFLWAECNVPRGFYQVRGNRDSLLRWLLGALTMIGAALWVGVGLSRQVRAQLRLLTLQTEGAPVEIPREPREVAQVAESLARLRERVAERQSQLEASRHELQRAVAERSRLLAVVSHELRTPLTSLLGSVQMRLDGLRGPVEDPKRLEKLQAQGQKLLVQINLLLQSGRAEAGLLDPSDGEVFLHDCLEEVCVELNLKPELELPPRSPVIKGDHAVLRMVLCSLFLELPTSALRLTVEGNELRYEALEGPPQEQLPFLSPESCQVLLGKMGARLEGHRIVFAVCGASC